MNQIIFEVQEDKVDGGYVATALGHAIAMQGDTIEELREMAHDAVRCHFGDGVTGKMPSVIRLHFVQDEALDPKKKALLKLKASIQSHKSWWLFPTESSVQGFLGTGTIFIVGDQPSTALWEFDHPHRRAFYDLLAAESAGDCHLTDFYKRRGLSGELRKNGKPVDFDKHLKFFLTEVELLRPSTILALGWDAYRLLLAQQSKNSMLKQVWLERVWHFGTVRHGMRKEFQARLRRAIIAARKRDSERIRRHTFLRFPTKSDPSSSSPGG